MVVNIKCFLIILLISLASCNHIQKECNDKINDYPNELKDLALRLDMNPIYGELLPPLQIYGGYGSTYLFEVSTFDEVGVSSPANAVFWATKNNKAYLIYAEEKNDVYEAIDTLKESYINNLEYDIEISGSYGMVVYDGILGLDKDLSNFVYLENNELSGPSNIYPTPSNGFWPIIIYQESSALVLYRYQGKWLKLVQIDD